MKPWANAVGSVADHLNAMVCTEVAGRPASAVSERTFTRLKAACVGAD